MWLSEQAGQPRKMWKTIPQSSERQTPEQMMSHLNWSHRTCWTFLNNKIDWYVIQPTAPVQSGLPPATTFLDTFQRYTLDDMGKNHHHCTFKVMPVQPSADKHPEGFPPRTPSLHHKDKQWLTRRRSPTNESVPRNCSAKFKESNSGHRWHEKLSSHLKLDIYV